MPLVANLVKRKADANTPVRFGTSPESAVPIRLWLKDPEKVPIRVTDRRKAGDEVRLIPPIAVLVGIIGCGGKDSPSGPSSAGTQPTTLNFSPTVSGPGYVLQDVTVTQSAGQVAATLRWNDSGKDLDLFWTTASCVVEGNGFAGTGCQIISQSISSSGMSETVSGPAAAGSTVRLFTVNFSSAPEPTTLVVVFRP